MIIASIIIVSTTAVMCIMGTDMVIDMGITTRT